MINLAPPPSPSDAVQQNSKIDTLQIGRALAALAVILRHVALSLDGFGAPLPSTLDLVFRQGTVGVDFFFVLSGFIITYSAMGARYRDPVTYFLRRFSRIYVPYAPIGIALAVFYSFVPTQWQWDWLTSITLFPIKPGPALSVAWTLQHEVLFYSIFGLLFYTNTLSLGLALWAAIIGLATGLGIKATVVAPINLEFIMGVIACRAYLAGRCNRYLPFLSLPIFALWIWTGCSREYSVLAGAAFALVLVPLVTLEARRHFSWPTSLLLVGNASYAIYLVHNPLISLVTRAVASLGWPVAFLVLLGTSITGGCLFYKLYERPALALIRRVAHRQRIWRLVGSSRSNTSGAMPATAEPTLHAGLLPGRHIR